jgi:hypothetical protein
MHKDQLCDLRTQLSIRKCMQEDVVPFVDHLEIPPLNEIAELWSP